MSNIHISRSWNCKIALYVFFKIAESVLYAQGISVFPYLLCFQTKNFIFYFLKKTPEKQII